MTKQTNQKFLTGLYQIAQRVIELEKAGKKIIKFNIGDPDQKTPFKIIEAAFLAMKKGKTKYCHFGGEKELREKLAKIYKANPERTIISPGSKWAIFSILYLLWERNANLILPSPYWTAYQGMAKKIGWKIKLIKTKLEKNWQIDLREIENSIDKRTKLIILNNPNNPTSKIINGKIFEKIVEMANKNKIKILSDETYSEISFKKIKSILEFPGENIFVNSFSKTFAMTGWRLGFSILPIDLAKEMAKLNQITITCVPLFIQEAGIRALEMREKTAQKMREIYKKRANLACQILKKTRLKFSEPDAPFYLFPKCFLDSEKLALKLLEEGIAITPGTAFGDYKEYFRISLTLPEKELKFGLKKLARYFQC